MLEVLTVKDEGTVAAVADRSRAVAQSGLSDLLFTLPGSVGESLLGASSVDRFFRALGS
jgi:hypothetical protein